MARIQGDSDGPSPDPAIVRALARLDPRLYIVFRSFVINPKTGGNLVTRRGTCIYYPRWHLFLDQGDHQEYVFPYQDRETGEPILHLDERLIDSLQRDAGRHMTAAEINVMIDAKREARKAKRQRDTDELWDQVYHANERKIQEAMEGDNLHRGPQDLRRPATAFGYAGQTNHASSAEGEGIPLTAEEEGWELPDFKREIGDADHRSE